MCLDWKLNIMNPRKLTEFTTPDIQKHLATLIDTDVNVRDYQAAMYALGESLGALLPKDSCDGELLVVSTSEDADFLTSGYISSLDKLKCKYKLAIFWNHHYSLENGESVAPITNKFIQNGFESCNRVVLLKSIISGSCVIRTNLLALLDSLKNLSARQSIIVAAPVMHENGESNLKKEFPNHINDKFLFHTFAIDINKDKKGNVLDGIGGEVYAHLGLETQPALSKKGYMPKLVESLLFGG